MIFHISVDSSTVKEVGHMFYSIFQNKIDYLQEESQYGQVHIADNWRGQGFWIVS